MGFIDRDSVKTTAVYHVDVDRLCVMLAADLDVDPAKVHLDFVWNLEENDIVAVNVIVQD